MEREGGRGARQLRPLETETGLLNRADGSARVSAGGTEVMVSVVGPVEAGGRAERADRAVVEAAWMPLSGQPGSNDDVRRAETVRQAVEAVALLAMHPRCKLAVTVQVVRPGGSLLAVALTAVGLALLDAGVHCRAVLTAAAVAVLPGGHLVIDPTRDEEAVASAVLTVATRTGAPGEVVSHMRGALPPASYAAAAESARLAAAAVASHARVSTAAALERRMAGV